MDTLPIWDREGMLDRIGGDVEIAMAVIEGFIITIPEQVDVLKGFLDSGNLNGITHTAHSLKGVAATVGGERLRALAMNMEQAGKTEDLEGARSHFDDFKREFDVLLKTISESDLNPT